MPGARSFFWLLLLGLSVAHAETVQVAVAANFAAPLKALTRDFEIESGHKLLMSAGATGKLFAQIKSGAPFDVLLAADSASPARLIQEGQAVANSQATYAIGRLVLWSADAQRVDPQAAVLSNGNFKHLAIAAPAVLLNKGKGNPAATALLAFLKTEKSKSVIRSFGYEVP